MPRSHCVQMFFQRSIVRGWDSEDCSLSRSSREDFMRVRSSSGIALSAMRLAMVSGSSSSQASS
ncbi:hypothetical protein D9M70_554180 [compost metagenome]